MKNSLFILFVIAAAVVGCQMPEKPPVFKSISKIKTASVSGASLEITTNATFHNPNNMGLKLKGVEIDVLFDGKKVGHISQRKQVKVLPNADFNIPLNAQVDLKQLNLVNGIFGMLAGKKMKAQFIGYIRISKNGVGMRVPIEHEEMLRLNL